jgi:hypothetical protein
MMTPVTPRSLAAWELGDLSEISPSLIVRDEHDLVGRLILRLAVAFNDLKGMILLDQYRLAFAGTAANEISAHAGQSAGLLIQVHRFIGGIVNEALKVIDEERTAIDGAEVAELLASLPTPVQNFGATSSRKLRTRRKQRTAPTGRCLPVYVTSRRSITMVRTYTRRSIISLRTLPQCITLKLTTLLVSTWMAHAISSPMPLHSGITRMPDENAG